jgi:hypothetical protein
MQSERWGIEEVTDQIMLRVLVTKMTTLANTGCQAKTNERISYTK